MNQRPTVVVAVHDGFYGCGTGAGYANFGFLDILARWLPPQVQLVVLPVWLASGSDERHPAWHARTRTMLRRAGAAVHPVDNGTLGRDRWGNLDNFRHLVRATADRVLHTILPSADQILMIAFDAPFFGLPALLPARLRRHLVLVPRSSALIHDPGDIARVHWERAGLHAGLADGTTIATISHYLRDHLRQDYGIPRESLTPLHDGLASDDWYPRNVPGGRMLLPNEFIFAMGRAQPYKGFGDLLDALALYREHGGRPPHVVLAATSEQPGLNPYQRFLSRRLDDLALESTLLTQFTPEVTDLLWHPGLRAVVVPSRAEPFGRIPMESFAAGAAPVVATTAGGLAEQITDGVTGFTCPPNSPGELATALARALTLHHDDRAIIRQHGRHRALRDYNHPAAIHRFLSEIAPWLPLPRPDDQLRLLSTTTAPITRRSPVSTVPPVKVPIGLQAQHWNTIPPQRVVLIVAHHVTSLIRLRDVITVFDSDPRIQLVFTCNGSDPFQHGLNDMLNDIGAITIPWSQAINTEFDLAITANHGGLTEINAPLVVISHGIGYAKHSPGNPETRKPGNPETRKPGNPETRKPGNPETRKPGNPETRKPGNPETRKPGNPETRSVFGLSPEWLLYDGRPIASSLVLSHPEQVERLAAITPQAVGTAVVAGDPCYDRMLRSEHLRDRYRAALGLGPGQKLVVVATSWWRRSVMGSWPSVYRELLACLPLDEYRVAALVHPNIWHGHGPWQVHTWLADCTRAGLVLVSPVDGWKAALVAADLVVGDHGATTCYGAALNKPVLLASFPDGDVAAGSAVDLLGHTAARLNRHQPLRTQIDYAIRDHSADRYTTIRELVSSCPGESAARLRRLFYAHLDLPEPSSEPPVTPIPAVAVHALPRLAEHADHVVCELGHGTHPTTITRYPADVAVDQSTADYLDNAGLVVHEDHPQQSLLSQAAIVLVDASGQQHTQEALADALRRHPGSALAATTHDDAVVCRTREGLHIVLSGGDTTTCASLVYAWLLAGLRITALPPAHTVFIGGNEVAIRLLSVAVEPVP